MDGGGFVSFRRFVHAWSVHAEADESRSTAATPPPSAWTKAGSTFEQPINEVRDHQQVLESPWQLAQTALRELLERSEAQTLNVANVSSSNSRDLAAAGAMFLAASIGAEAPLFKMATVTEESAVRLLSKLPMVAFEDMLSASSLASMQESLPAIVATSLLVASAMGAANGQLPSEAAEGPAEWLQELNATAQKIWESGTGSLNTQATTLLREVEKLWAAVDSQLSVEEVEAAAAATPVASSSHGIALRCGSARQQGTDWILPLEAQLFRRNEGRHAMLLGLCRQLLFRTLDGMSESDFDEGAMERYEERARLIFRSLQLPLLHDRTLQLLEVRIGGPRDDNSGWQRLPPTNAHGVVEANVRFSEEDIQLIDRLQGQVAVEVRVAKGADTVDSSTDPSRRPSAPPVQAVAELLSPEGIGVISDIDDTVKVTEVFYGIKAVLQNTFLKSFDAVPGMAALYQGWAKRRASFHYVSKSPPELHGPLSEFLQHKGFPVSSIHLCPLLGRDRANFKLRQVSSLLSQFPKRRFILVGDSGERDPEVYAEIMRKHPKQVLKVLIRAVQADDVDNVARARAAFKGFNEAKWQVFTDPAHIVEPEFGDSVKMPTWLQWPELPDMADLQAQQSPWPTAMAARLDSVAVD